MAVATIANHPDTTFRLRVTRYYLRIRHHAPTEDDLPATNRLWEKERERVQAYSIVRMFADNREQVIDLDHEYLV